MGWRTAFFDATGAFDRMRLSVGDGEMIVGEGRNDFGGGMSVELACRVTGANESWRLQDGKG
jgi:hypothetical protein